jgi:para-nitrobenzyl esterase
MPEWKPYDPATRATMTIDVSCRAVDNYLAGDLAAAATVRLDPYNRAALLTYRD